MCKENPRDLFQRKHMQLGQPIHVVPPRVIDSMEGQGKIAQRQLDLAYICTYIGTHKMVEDMT